MPIFHFNNNSTNGCKTKQQQQKSQPLAMIHWIKCKKILSSLYFHFRRLAALRVYVISYTRFCCCYFSSFVIIVGSCCWCISESVSLSRSRSIRLVSWSISHLFSLSRSFTHSVTLFITSSSSSYFFIVFYFLRALSLSLSLGLLTVFTWLAFVSCAVLRWARQNKNDSHVYWMERKQMWPITPPLPPPLLSSSSPPNKDADTMSIEIFLFFGKFSFLLSSLSQSVNRINWLLLSLSLPLFSL